MDMQAAEGWLKTIPPATLATAFATLLGALIAAVTGMAAGLLGGWIANRGHQRRLGFP